MSKARKQLADNARRQTPLAAGGAMQTCQHPPCHAKTTAQFCVAHALESGSFAPPPPPMRNGKFGRRVFAW